MKTKIVAGRVSKIWWWEFVRSCTALDLDPIETLRLGHNPSLLLSLDMQLLECGHPDSMPALTQYEVFEVCTKAGEGLTRLATERAELLAQRFGLMRARLRASRDLDELATALNSIEAFCDGEASSSKKCASMLRELVAGGLPQFSTGGSEYSHNAGRALVYDDTGWAVRGIAQNE